MDVDAADVVLGSGTDGLLLALAQQGDDSRDDVLLVHLVQPGLSAHREVHFGSDFGPDLRQLARFFQDMSADWKGWKGTRQFDSLEHDLTITATHDGHIRLLVEVADWHPDGWRVRAWLSLEPGEELAQAADAFAQLAARSGRSTPGGA